MYLHHFIPCCKIIRTWHRILKLILHLYSNVNSFMSTIDKRCQTTLNKGKQTYRLELPFIYFHSSGWWDGYMELGKKSINYQFIFLTTNFPRRRISKVSRFKAILYLFPPHKLFYWNKTKKQISHSRLKIKRLIIRINIYNLYLFFIKSLFIIRKI